MSAIMIETVWFAFVVIVVIAIVLKTNGADK